jgi:hypothetical protein
VEEDPLSLRVLTYLADAYRPVMSDWIDYSEIALALAAPISAIQSCCEDLERQTLIETAPPDDENESSAAIITVRGLLSIGRPP